MRTRTAAAYGVITASDPLDRRTQVLAVRLLRRIHLGSTHQGLALQHMNQITERIDRESFLGAAATFAPRYAALLPDAKHPVVTFRVGHPQRAARLSPRRSVPQSLARSTG